jgi:hypothetical protein
MKAPRLPGVAPIVAIFTAFFVALSTSGCFFQLGEERSGSAPTSTAGAPSPTAPSTPTTPPLDVSIDPGGVMSVSPGQTVGVYVESTGNGHWKVLTTCDTSVSGASCSFDLNVTPEAGSKLSGVTGEGLTFGDDAMAQLDDGTVQLVAQTKYLATGLSFDTEPGALIEVNMLLGGVPQTGVVHWVSGGKVQDGAPSNPVNFVPPAS